MKGIHFINRRETDGYRLINLEQSSDEKGVCYSGYWRLDDDDADALVGGRLYLHETKSQPSAFGGEVLSYSRDGERVKIRFKALAECKGQDWRGHNHAMAYTSQLIDI